MNDTISERQIKILRALASGDSLSRSTIQETISESRLNTIRELNNMIERQLIKVSGEARATKYAITEQARRVILWDAEAYLSEEPDKRNARFTSLEPGLFKTVEGVIGKPPIALENAAARRRKAGDSATAQRELERFVIELSWKSSKIEGNTYTLLDTERLIREAEEASGHGHTEALMILNHKRAFDYIWTHQNEFRSLSSQRMDQVHELLVKGLDVPLGLRETPVGITGTAYVPPASKVEIASYLRDIIDVINDIDQPVEKALAALVLLPYLQPFADGNKRTSRLIANAVLLSHGYPPLSYRSVDEQAYKGALIIFYEQGSLANFRQLYLKQLEESAESYYFPIPAQAG